MSGLVAALFRLPMTRLSFQIKYLTVCLQHILKVNISWIGIRVLSTFCSPNFNRKICGSAPFALSCFIQTGLHNVPYRIFPPKLILFFQTWVISALFLNSPNIIKTGNVKLSPTHNTLYIHYRAKTISKIFRSQSSQYKTSSFLFLKLNSSLYHLAKNSTLSDSCLPTSSNLAVPITKIHLSMFLLHSFWS